MDLEETGPHHCGDAESPEEIEWLRGLIAEGLASGVCELSPKEIIEEIIADRRARHRA